MGLLAVLLGARSYVRGSWPYYERSKKLLLIPPVIPQTSPNDHPPDRGTSTAVDRSEAHRRGAGQHALHGPASGLPDMPNGENQLGERAGWEVGEGEGTACTIAACASPNWHACGQ